VQELQQQASDRGDELERVAGAKERADGKLKRSDSHLQQANTTIQVPPCTAIQTSWVCFVPLAFILNL